MCGINGIVLYQNANRQNNASIGADVVKMNAAIAHRGPDGSGTYVREGVGLGHHRLSIIDLSTAGAQPMSNPDESLVLVFNGEIYNYRELALELKRAGYEFRSNSDTEVILHAYSHWGESCVTRFNGMWAFAIWDTKRRTLFASRDRLGVKPFVYRHQHDELVFSSEVAGVLAARRVTEANLGKLHDYLAYGYRTNNGETFFAGIHELPAGHNLSFENDQLKISRYWSLPTQPTIERNPSQLAEEFGELLRDAVLLRFRSDVPVALLQSGGLDSSAICRVVDDEIEAGNINFQSVTAFTSIYPGSRYDESALVRQLIATCRYIKSVEIEPEGAALASSLPAYVQAMGEPVFSTTSYAHWRLMHAVRDRGIKVVLNGQGSDEAFGGYGRYIVGYRLLDLLLSRPHEAIAEFQAIRNNLGFGAKMIAMQVAKAALGRRAASKFRARWVDGVSALLDPEFQSKHDAYLPDQGATLRPRNLDRHLRSQLEHYGFTQILHYEDQSSMSCGVEIRSPFIDYRLMEFAFSINDANKFSRGMTKRIVRQTFASKLPNQIIKEKEKIGFDTPFESWMKDPALKKFVTDLIMSSEFAGRRIWRAPEIRRQYEQAQNGGFGFPLWRFINVELWARAFSIENL